MKVKHDAATGAKAVHDAATRHEEAAAEKKTSRRGFTKSVAAALAAAPVALSQAGARQRPAEPKAPPNPQPTPTPAPQQQQPPSPVAEAYAAVARARFGEHVTAEEFERVRRDLAGNVRAADALRAAKLKNSDEPDFIFEA
ncbi:MAG TPA: hypothetical protein VE360_10405 [Pyrinomonadaceae bacterium]|nr:hypothetical protein [Pyrinomonadaceae bacterium]